MKNLAFLSCFGLLTLASANAQEFPKFSFGAGAGFTNSVGSSAGNLSNGWNAQADATFNFSRFIGARIDAAWDGMGIGGVTLANAGAANGDMHIFSASLEPVVHLAPIHHIDIYAFGGGGVYHLADQFGSPSTVPVLGNTFFGYYPGQGGTFTNYVVNRPGFDVGAGLSFGGALHGRFFAEAKWNHVFLTDNYHVDYLPVTFGFRW